MWCSTAGIPRRPTRRLDDAPVAHPPGRESGDAARLRRGAEFRAGTFFASHYAKHRVAMLRGDMMVLFTDGIAQAVNAHGEEFGEGRARKVMEGQILSQVPAIFRALIDAVEAFADPGIAADDMCLAGVTACDPAFCPARFRTTPADSPCPAGRFRSPSGKRAADKPFDEPPAVNARRSAGHMFRAISSGKRLALLALISVTACGGLCAQGVNAGEEVPARRSAFPGANLRPARKAPQGRESDRGGKARHRRPRRVDRGGPDPGGAEAHHVLFPRRPARGGGAAISGHLVGHGKV